VQDGNDRCGALEPVLRALHHENGRLKKSDDVDIFVCVENRYK
jgi:hypothetical protein